MDKTIPVVSDEGINNDDNVHNSSDDITNGQYEGEYIDDENDYDDDDDDEEEYLNDINAVGDDDDDDDNDDDDCNNNINMFYSNPYVNFGLSKINDKGEDEMDDNDHEGGQNFITVKNEKILASASSTAPEIKVQDLDSSSLLNKVKNIDAGTSKPSITKKIVIGSSDNANLNDENSKKALDSSSENVRVIKMSSKMAPASITNLTLEELKTKCSKMNLSTQGTRERLQERLLQALKQKSDDKKQDKVSIS